LNFLIIETDLIDFVNKYYFCYWIL
jgi:hypothetical protein